MCMCVCICVWGVCVFGGGGLGRPLLDRTALRIKHLRYVGWIKKADEVTQQGGSVTDDQVNCDDTDDSDSDVRPAYSSFCFDFCQNICHKTLFMEKLFKSFLETLRHGCTSFFTD